MFHWSCLNKYASELPGDTAPAGYQCPKCKECIFPPPNLVSPVVDMLRKKLETVSWSRVGLGQSPVITQFTSPPPFSLHILNEIILKDCYILSLIFHDKHRSSFIILFLNTLINVFKIVFLFQFRMFTF